MPWTSALNWGAETYVFWGGREGVETNAAKDARTALAWFRDALDFLCEYSRSQGYPYKFALEPKPNEPRGDIFLPTIGHALAFIHTLALPDMVGVNPEVAHDTISGLDFTHGVAQALDAGKLFHIDLNGQKPGRYDQDHRFGSEDPKQAFFLVKLLEDAQWNGMRHFDSHAYRRRDEEGVWDFAAGSMRTYLILKEKAAQFQRGCRDPGAALGVGRARSRRRTSRHLLPATATTLKRELLDLPAVRAQGYRYERLDQLTMEILLGVR
jgi:xylose isomerase